MRCQDTEAIWRKSTVLGKRFVKNSFWNLSGWDLTTIGNGCILGLARHWLHGKATQTESFCLTLPCVANVKMFQRFDFLINGVEGSHGQMDRHQVQPKKQIVYAFGPERLLARVDMAPTSCYDDQSLNGITSSLLVVPYWTIERKKYYYARTFLRSPGYSQSFMAIESIGTNRPSLTDSKYL